MTRLIAILLLLVFAVPACAQAPAKEEKKEDKQDEVIELGIPADFNAYLKKTYPNLDPGGEHDLFNLKDYKDKNKRHAYTVAMTQLLISYMTDLGLGSTIAKQFDQYARLAWAQRLPSSSTSTPAARKATRSPSRCCTRWG